MPIEIRGLAPLLAVFDMKASVRFYRDVLGFELVSTSAPGDDCGWALLRRGGAELMLNTAYDGGGRPPSPDPARVAAHRDTALFFGSPDVDAAYAHLRAHGVDAEAPFVQSYGMKQMYVKDPDGYTLCFQWPASAETSVATDGGVPPPPSLHPQASRAAEQRINLRIKREKLLQRENGRAAPAVARGADGDMRMRDAPARGASGRPGRSRI